MATDQREEQKGHPGQEGAVEALDSQEILHNNLG